MSRFQVPRWFKFLPLALTLLLVSCFLGGGSALPLRSDMLTDGFDRVVTYNLTGPAGKQQEKNEARLRGVNENASLLSMDNIFGRMSGSKTQDVQITMPNGVVNQVLGMVKTQRFAGYTHFMTVESASYSGVDAKGNEVCGVKVRLDFNRNLVQYAQDLRDFQSLWYYDVPCQREGQQFPLDLSKAKLRALVVNQVWQARIAWGSFFYNMGHSVTIVGGPPAEIPAGWWLHLDQPNTQDDAMGTALFLNDLIDDLENSQQPWLEFNPDGKFAQGGSYLIYSAGDADQYLTLNRAIFNRQNQYAVSYRPDKQTAWDTIIIKPVYNFEWNDAGQYWSRIKGWGTDPFSGRLNEQGLPKDNDDNVIAELERIGWMNGPNAALEQIQFIHPGQTESEDRILYTMTVRAYVGANDSLILFGRVRPDIKKIQQEAPADEVTIEKPVNYYYDKNGERKKSPDDQQWTDEKWAEFLREATIWNWMADNPQAIGADLEVQYRFSDASSWAPVPCSDGKGTCGYNPVEWNLDTSYYLKGDTRTPWLISQLLGEVGVRTLGMSYVSGRYEGTGMLFALSQDVFRDEFFTGFTPESIWRFDARASQLPDTLAEAWRALNSQ